MRLSKGNNRRIKLVFKDEDPGLVPRGAKPQVSTKQPAEQSSCKAGMGIPGELGGGSSWPMTAPGKDREQSGERAAGAPLTLRGPAAQGPAPGFPSRFPSSRGRKDTLGVERTEHGKATGQASIEPEVRGNTAHPPTPGVRDLIWAPRPPDKSMSAQRTGGICRAHEDTTCSFPGETLPGVPANARAAGLGAWEGHPSPTSSSARIQEISSNLCLSRSKRDHRITTCSPPSWAKHFIDRQTK